MLIVLRDTMYNIARPLLLAHLYFLLSSLLLYSDSSNIGAMKHGYRRSGRSLTVLYLAVRLDRLAMYLYEVVILAWSL